jgi:hypothetical protein
MTSLLVTYSCLIRFTSSNDLFLILVISYQLESKKLQYLTAIRTEN